MSEHRAKVKWKRQSGDDSFDYNDYNREHEWVFENGHVVRASAAPRFHGDAECVDPEEAFVASVSACHMLTFLAMCSRERITVDSYEDDPVGYLEVTDARKLAITRVLLRPRVGFAQGQEPDTETLDRLHHQAHDECFIANSVSTVITVDGQSV